MILKEQCILGIEATGHTISVGIFLKGVPKGEIYLNNGRPGSETILSSIDVLLKSCLLEKGDLEGICLTLGPGSFTSMRLGLSIAEALGIGLNIPLYGTDLLSLIANSVPYYSKPVKVIRNAYKGELYLGVFDTSSGRAVALDEISLVTPERFFNELKTGELVLGNGIEKLISSEYDLDRKGVNWNVEKGQVITALDVISYLGNTAVREPGDVPLEPIYIRLSDAEICYDKKFGAKK